MAQTTLIPKRRQFLEGIKTSQKSFATTQTTITNLSKLLKERKEKREKISSAILTEKRKREYLTLRQESEDELKAKRVVTNPNILSSLGSVAANTGGSFIDRIVNTLGYLAAGWIIRNLPTWEGMAKEFIARLQEAGKIIGSFVTDSIRVFQSSYNLITGAIQNLKNFDLTDSSGNIRTSFDELVDSINNMGSELEAGIKLITTPLTQTAADGSQVGTYSGEEVPALGSTSTDMGAYEESAPSSSGGTVSPQTVYSYLKSKGLSHNHIMGIIAGIDGESSFQIGVQEKGHSKQGIGLFQYTYPSRKQAFLSAVPDYKTNWKGQIDYAVFKDPQSKAYLSRQFSTPEEAAEWWLVQWERPLESLRPSRRTKYKQFIASFKPSGGQTSSQQPQTAISSPSSSLSGKAIFGETGRVRNAANWVHGHFQTNTGTANDLINDTAPIVKGLIDSGITPELSRGQKFTKNMSMDEIKQLIRVGISQHSHSGDGRSVDIFVPKGTKVPFPVYDVRDTGGRGGVTAILPGTGKVWVGHLDPKSKSSGQMPTVKTTSQPAQTTPQPAQISPTPTQQSRQQMAQSLVPDNKPQDIVAIIPEHQMSPQMPQPSGAPSGGASPSVSMGMLLNNFMKQKLLLDLSYV